MKKKWSKIKKWGIGLVIFGALALIGGSWESVLFIAIGAFLLYLDRKKEKQKVSAFWDDAHKQIEAKTHEHEQASSLSDLAPEQIGTHKRGYHYKDVSIWVTWQFSGSYGKSCESAGIQRGDLLDLIFDSYEGDPDSVAVLWKGETIGHMKSNRLRGMVQQWHEKGYPIYAAVSHVGGETKILIELAFYGFIKYK